MSCAKLKLENGETVLSEGVTTIGRTPDNVVSFPEDSNVSRYHAEIEFRGGDHYLIDLNSSNGTSVNGNAVKGEVRLEPGDKILFGGSSEAEFLYGSASSANESGSELSNTPGMSEARSEMSSLGSSAQSEAEYAAQNAVHSAINNAVSGTGSSVATSTAGSSAIDVAAGSGPNSTVLIAGAVCGLAVVCVIAAGVFYATRGSSCNASASIIKPEQGDTIIAPTEIELKVENGECVMRAVFTLDGEVIASASGPDFSASIDPKDHPQLADGLDHDLQVILVDAKGEQIRQPSGVMLAFETRAVTKQPPTNVTVATANAPPVKTTAASQVTLIQMQDMAQRLVKQFSCNFAYNVSNKQFLQEVQKRTAEYSQEGYFARANTYRDAINVAFVREQNLDAPFGFMLAMSRSKFVPAKQGDEEGLFRMTNTFVSDNKYNGQCGTETLSDPPQNCAAKAAAIYMKAVVYGVFEGDLVYSAAAFGKTTQDAGAWKATLPQNRTDIWNVIKTPAEREQLLRFFAAGIVAENPQKFGLAKDRPLSELYRVTM
ncbi:MAG: FHA domain-containing protein [Pyrinomonadaceae bacterium]